MTRLIVQNMTCGHCKAAVERAITALDPAAQVAVDLPGKTVDVTSGVSTEALIAALSGEGYDATAA